ncbi:biotin/lipoyl-binding protein [Youngiibacter multivorans]|uniref:HlyD family secretion protein n=1 Tax=Youngiibacter multivorans TaxID=937251 RepID=A0ABS4G089_9CLOT|nr:biotin/lipoyl-binding protein [Youngiibacter multivorans]MBP1917965.1 HlyD family secretion protein [Youngiibacter multivorans]
MDSLIEEKSNPKKIMLIAAFAAMLVFSGCTKSDDVAAAAKISTQEVKLGNLVVGSYADGRVAMSSANLSFEISGKLTEVKVVAGQTVQAGELLAVLDESELSDAVASARRDLDKARATYNDAVSSRKYSLSSEKIKLDSLYSKYKAPFDDAELKEALDAAQARLDEKSAEHLTATSAYDEAVAAGASGPELAEAQKQVEAAENARLSAEASLSSAQKAYDSAYSKYLVEKAATKESYDLQKLKYDSIAASSLSVTNAEYGVSTAQSKLDSANANLEKARLYSPISGKVVLVNGKAGDFVSGRTGDSSGTSSASAFITITDTSVMSITASINEGDISDLEAGQSIKANIEALGLIGLEGKVSGLGEVPKIDNSGIVSYTVTSVLDKPNERIYDGMSAFVTFIKKEKTNVLLISNKAIFIEEGKQYVQVRKEDGTIEKRSITAGLTNGSQSEVVDGLEVGETVVTSGIVK